MIPVNIPDLSGNEAAYLAECISTGWISSDGPFVRRFEEGFAAASGRRHGIAVCNGSLALDLAVAALGIGPGDEVIVPDFTIISCALAVVRSGATPVFVDPDPDTWTITPSAIAGAITPRTRAIMAVHIYGLPCDMPGILSLAGQHGIQVIEDAAELIGGRCAGDPCGSFGRISTVSFYANKHVATGEGGMVLCDDDDLAERCRLLRNLGFDRERRFIHEEAGWNMRMGNLQAAVGLAQLERLPATVARKRRIGMLYRQLLAGLPLRWQPASTPWAENECWVFGIVTDDGAPDAIELMSRMRTREVQCRHFFHPMSRQPCLRRLGIVDAEAPEGNAALLARRGIYLPSGVGTTDDQIRTAAAALRDALAC